MLVGVAISFANVISRYVFGYALFWAEETLVFLAIWGVFIGVAAAAYDRAHLNMDFFSDAFRGGASAFVNLGMTVTLLACCIFMVLQSWQVVSLFYQSGVVSVSAGVPKWIPHAALLVGFALSAVAVLLRLRLYLTGKP
jgi:TRAP-type C4-dicarboxylate transport system permease small subunit